MQPRRRGPRRLRRHPRRLRSRAPRHSCLLVFFSTIGLSAKLRLLKEGGRLLAILGVLTLLFLVLQNGVGVLTATLLGERPGYGLIGGSVSLAGGHGTAITWGALGEEAGFSKAPRPWDSPSRPSA